MDPQPTTLRPELAAYLELYAAGRFFDAHEVLERAWRRSPHPEMTFYQGLIQWAVAFEHQRRGNPAGARRQLAKAWAKLAAAPEGFLGLDLAPARRAQPALAAALARREAGEPAPVPAAPPIRARPAGPDGRAGRSR